MDINCVLTDITKLSVDAIVNAVNNSLLGGGGVDGAIHAAAGPELLEYCKKLKGCETGKAKLSPGFNLAAKNIIHTVGPVWQGGNENEPELLKSCYKNSMKIALENNFKSIAFPAISCGVYGYPIELAANIAVDSIKEFIKKNNSNDIKVYFVCFSHSDLNIYNNILI